MKICDVFVKQQQRSILSTVRLRLPLSLSLSQMSTLPSYVKRVTKPIDPSVISAQNMEADKSWKQSVDRDLRANQLPAALELLTNRRDYGDCISRNALFVHRKLHEHKERTELQKVQIEKWKADQKAEADRRRLFDYTSAAIDTLDAAKQTSTAVQYHRMSRSEAVRLYTAKTAQTLGFTQPRIIIQSGVRVDLQPALRLSCEACNGLFARSTLKLFTKVSAETSVGYASVRACANCCKKLKETVHGYVHENELVPTPYRCEQCSRMTNRKEITEIILPYPENGDVWVTCKECVRTCVRCGLQITKAHSEINKQYCRPCRLKKQSESETPSPATSLLSSSAASKPKPFVKLPPIPKLNLKPSDTMLLDL